MFVLMSWWKVVDKPQVSAGRHGSDVLLVLTISGSQVNSDRLSHDLSPFKAEPAVEELTFSSHL